MVVFSRKLNEEVVVEEVDGSARHLKVSILEINDGSVCLGIEMFLEEPPPFDRRHPEIRDLVATLWRHRNTLRNRAICGTGQEVSAQVCNS